MQCEKHNFEIPEGKKCGSCYQEETLAIEDSLEELREKQKLHWDSPVCMCDICRK